MRWRDNKKVLHHSLQIQILGDIIQIADNLNQGAHNRTVSLCLYMLRKRDDKMKKKLSKGKKLALSIIIPIVSVIVISIAYIVYVNSEFAMLNYLEDKYGVEFEITGKADRDSIESKMHFVTALYTAHPSDNPELVFEVYRGSRREGGMSHPFIPPQINPVRNYNNFYKSISEYVKREYPEIDEHETINITNLSCDEVTDMIYNYLQDVEEVRVHYGFSLEDDYETFDLRLGDERSKDIDIYYFSTKEEIHGLIDGPYHNLKN